MARKRRSGKDVEGSPPGFCNIGGRLLRLQHLRSSPSTAFQMPTAPSKSKSKRLWCTCAMHAMLTGEPSETED
jgi:hypothetical protein